MSDFKTSARKGVLALSEDRKVFLKQIGNNYIQQIEYFDGSSSHLQQVSLHKNEFVQLWKLVLPGSTRWIRKYGSHEGTEFWIDSYLNDLKGLHTAIFGFPNEQRAFEWTIPNHIGPEISADPRFQPHTLLQHPISFVESIPTQVDSSGDNTVVGAIPYRVSGKSIEVFTVETRKSRTVIFPKGQIEKGRCPVEIAHEEALEEAGLEGHITGHPILIPYKEESPQNLLLYPFKVSKVLKTWKEQRVRNRQRLTLDAALNSAGNERILPGLKYLARFLDAQSDKATVSN